MARQKTKAAKTNPAAKTGRKEELAAETPASIALNKRLQTRSANLIRAKKNPGIGTTVQLDVLQGILGVLEENPGAVPGEEASAHGVLVGQQVAATLAQFKRRASKLVYREADRNLVTTAATFVKGSLKEIRAAARTDEEKQAVKAFVAGKEPGKTPAAVARALRQLESGHEKYPSVWENANLTEEDIAQAGHYAEKLEAMSPKVKKKQTAVSRDAAKRKRIAWVAKLWCDAVVSSARLRLKPDDPVRAEVLEAGRVTRRGGVAKPSTEEDGTTPPAEAKTAAKKGKGKAKKSRKTKNKKGTDTAPATPPVPPPPETGA